MKSRTPEDLLYSVHLPVPPSVRDQTSSERHSTRPSALFDPIMSADDTSASPCKSLLLAKGLPILTHPLPCSRSRPYAKYIAS